MGVVIGVDFKNKTGRVCYIRDMHNKQIRLGSYDMGVGIFLWGVILIVCV